MSLAERQGLDAAARTWNFHRYARRDLVAIENRRVLAICRHLEAIGEALPELLSCQFVVVHRDASPPIVRHHAQIIDAVGMVCMVMGVEHAVEPTDADVEQLLAKIRR